MSHMGGSGMQSSVLSIGQGSLGTVNLPFGVNYEG